MTNNLNNNTYSESEVIPVIAYPVSINIIECDLQQFALELINRHLTDIEYKMFKDGFPGSKIADIVTNEALLVLNEITATTYQKNVLDF